MATRGNDARQDLQMFEVLYRVSLLVEIRVKRSCELLAASLMEDRRQRRKRKTTTTNI